MRKGFQKVTVNLPKVGKINLFNFHMSAGGYRSHSESRASEMIRCAQIQQLLNTTLDKMPTLLVGDLNAGPEASNYRQVLNDGFKDSFKMADGNGLTWDPENSLVLSGSESYLPAQRIDHIFVNHTALSRLSPISGEMVLTEKSIHVDNNQSIPISDHYGVQVRFTIKESI
jgi:endonuclease/exonuclease/phosphatase family metal-dependent hydrolase